jgi:D-alanine-D-alanine ligase
MTEHIRQISCSNPGIFGRVAVLYGGQSAERKVSLDGGKAVLRGLQELGIDAIGLDAGPDWVRQLLKLQIDRVFILLHGSGGEDGIVQGALESLQLPYTGSGILASALAFDKVRCKQFWRGIDLPTPLFAILDSNTNWPRVLDHLGGEVMVKPARQGSSFGMSRASTSAELEAAWQMARQFDESVLAEQWLAGPEYTVAVVNNRPLPTIKLETDRPFYDYEAKYVAHDTRYLCPCGLSAKQETRVQELAVQAYSSLGCEGWGRVDLMADHTGLMQVLEVNTVPGMTDHSLVPKAALAEKLTFGDLLLEILSTTISVQPRRKK